MDVEKTISNLPAGKNVKVIVTARNATGESQPRDAVAAMVP